MAIFNSSALHAGTPSLAVLCPRGFPVGELACYREQATQAVELRITRHWHDARGNLVQSLDPRLAETATPNFRWHSDLAGRTLYTESVDAGPSVVLPDVAGRPLLAVSATGVSQACFHEVPSLPGRLLAVTEQGVGEALPRVAERYRWAGLSPAEKNRNLAGQCVRHYDTAGLIELQNLALSGAALAQSRCVLAGEDEADWAGEDEQAWQSTLEPERYVTLRTLDATGIQLTQTDARGHQQRQAYDVAGQLRGSWLTLQGQAEQAIVASLCYSPSGHKQQAVHGNGVITDYGLDPMTQRLTGIRVQRPGTQISAATTLQDLHYHYDPVGNVQSVRNDAEATRFWRNQKVTAESTFTYDSLYQLVQATGRERVGRGAQGPQLPDVLVPLPTDDSALTNYTRRYSYDRAGNLIQLQHSAPASNNAYTTQMTVSNRSNRAVLAREGLLPEQVDELFDAGGHQLELLAGQDLRWNARGELAQVKPIEREAGANDREWYRYGNDGMRLLKRSEQQAADVTQAQRVLYLDGLELRDTHEDTRLHVIKVAAGGGAQVQVLHWASGLPAGLDNDQVRYSYHNLIGSNGMELDAQGQVISLEEYYAFGGTAVWTARNDMEASFKTLRFSAKECDKTGLYYYGARYYQPWSGRWLSVDPMGALEGLNLFRMVRNNPSTLHDPNGNSSKDGYIYAPLVEGDVVRQILNENLVRYRKGKPPYTIIVDNESSRSVFELLVKFNRRQIGIEMQSRERKAAEKQMRTAKHNVLQSAAGATLGGTFSSAAFGTQWAMAGAVGGAVLVAGSALIASVIDRDLHADKLQSRRHHANQYQSVLDALNVIIGNSPNGFASLDSNNAKLYITGHGAPGDPTLGADDVEGSTEIDAGEIATRLREGGLPRDFVDIRVSSCNSGDSRSPTSFELEELADASAVDFDADPIRQPFARTLRNALRGMGFSNVKVTGYHGVVWSSQYGKMSEIGSVSLRRSRCSRVF